MRTGYHTGSRVGNAALDITRRGVLHLSRPGSQKGALSRPERTLQNYTLWALRARAPRERHPHHQPQPGPHRACPCWTRLQLPPCLADGYTMAEQDGSAGARKGLARAQWQMRCRLHDIERLTASLEQAFYRLGQLEDEERRCLAELEACVDDPATLQRIGEWADVSGRGRPPPAWWPRFDGWRFVIAKKPTLEHRDGRQRVFESADELVAFVRELSAPNLPAAPMQRVRPQAVRRRRAAGNGGDDV